MADFKVIETTMEGNWEGRESGGLRLTQGFFSLAEDIKLQEELIDIQQITEENQKSLAGKVGWSVVGGVLTGGIGAIAGFILGGNKKEITFLAELTKERRFIGACNPKQFQTLCGYALKNRAKKNDMDGMKEYLKYPVGAEQKWYVIETIAQEGLYATFSLKHVKGVTTGVEGYMLMEEKRTFPICFTKSIDAAIKRMYKEAEMDSIAYGYPED